MFADVHAMAPSVDTCGADWQVCKNWLAKQADPAASGAIDVISLNWLSLLQSDAGHVVTTSRATPPRLGCSNMAK